MMFAIMDIEVSIAVFINASKMRGSENKFIHLFIHSSHKYLLTAY